MINNENHEPCFKEKIEAWEIGPVVSVVYQEYKQYGSTNIPPVDSYLVFDIDDPWNVSRVEFDEDCIDEKDKKLINAVVTKLADYSAADLVDITQKQRPWLDNYSEFENKEITLDSIKKYFSEL